MKSRRLAINVLIDLYNLGKETKATFDFINKTIERKDSESKEGRQLLNDYLSWLPDHFDSHNCNLTQLKKLEITFWTDFDKAVTPPRMNDKKEFKMNAVTRWKADGKDEQIIEISQTELINSKYLKIGMPEL